MSDDLKPAQPSSSKRSLTDHPSQEKLRQTQKANQSAANITLPALWILLALVVGGYSFLHLVTADCSISKNFNRHDALCEALHGSPTNSVLLDQAGRIVSLSETDLRWYLGRDQASALIASLRDRGKRIDDLEDRIVGQALLEFRVRFSEGIGLPNEAGNQMIQLSNHTLSNNYTLAATTFTGIVQGWSDETRKRVGEKAIFELDYGLVQLARLQREQVDSVRLANLQPPRMHQIVWSSPLGAIFEAVTWSIIGTVVNLLVNLSHCRARGTFRREELWVCGSKLLYGPVLSFVLILSIYFGVLNAGTEMRFWLLPLLGFLFGYNTRKLAHLIDNLSESLLGKFGKSASDTESLEAQAAQHAAAAVRAETQPSSIAEMKRVASSVVDSAIIAAVKKPTI